MTPYDSFAELDRRATKQDRADLGAHRYHLTGAFISAIFLGSLCLWRIIAPGIYGYVLMGGAIAVFTLSFALALKWQPRMLTSTEERSGKRSIFFVLALIIFMVFSPEYLGLAALQAVVVAVLSFLGTYRKLAQPRPYSAPSDQGHAS